MRLDTEIKLNYEDVLLKPKRSTLSSRRDVEMEREFVFRNSQLKYKCLPIIASNMDVLAHLVWQKYYKNIK